MTLTMSFERPRERRHWDVFAQAARYGVVGLIITILFSAAYWLVTELGGIDPMLSLAIVFTIFSAISYFAHGAVSFQGYGQRDRQHVRALRFFMVNLVGFAFNQGFVWLLVKHLHGPTWWPIIPFVLVTPWITFALHRKWVYA